MKPFSLLATIVTLSAAVLPLLTPSCGGSTETQTGSGSGGASGTMGTGAAGTNATGSGASGTSSTGGSQQGGGAGTMTTSTDTCTANEECTWGEIPREILAATDCVCLYGCVYLPQTKVTAARRLQQHKALCNPTTNGKGQPCGIDDCARPGEVACIDGMCKAAPKDAGPAD